ncbi:hypothetical protein A2T55_04815 [Brevibacterium linens]|uniref:Uncharacterized protein n=1 Tax=Brevibacterium linens TaxID=1703 RepID=A0A142NK72_BRELN|nr:hypothetical protein A2T55_04815 [Brevibacterium linens]
MVFSRWATRDPFIGYWGDCAGELEPTDSDDRKHHLLLVADDEQAARSLTEEVKESFSWAR